MPTSPSVAFRRGRTLQHFDNLLLISCRPQQCLIQGRYFKNLSWWRKVIAPWLVITRDDSQNKRQLVLTYEGERCRCGGCRRCFAFLLGGSLHKVELMAVTVPFTYITSNPMVFRRQSEYHFLLFRSYCQWWTKKLVCSKRVGQLQECWWITHSSSSA